MAKDEVLFGYALLDETQAIVSIDDIDRQYAHLHKFYCPHCHNEMYATFGDIQQPHFRHNGEKCQHSNYLHDLAEDVFYEQYTKCLDDGVPFFLELRIPLPCNNACVLKKHADCKEHYIHKTVDLTKEYTLISLETKVDIDGHYRRPDILLESTDGKQLWIEIWVSHETEEDKRKDGRIIEIKIDSEKDLERIYKHKITQSEGEDIAVRIFGLETTEPDNLFMEDDDLPVSSFPCEQYYCFEVIGTEFKDCIIDNTKKTITPGLTYRIILGLNWRGRHDYIGNPLLNTDLKELRSVCKQRYYSYTEKGSLFLDKSYDSLIAFEWKSEGIKSMPVPVNTRLPHSPHKSQFQPTSQQTSAAVNSAAAIIDNIEWVDLGLPSGTLWAKEDVGEKLSFIGAQRTCGVHVPSKENANELKTYCTMKWDDGTHTLELTGPNGNTLSFLCKERSKSYWLNAYDNCDMEFGQCFHIEHGRCFWINEKDASSAIHVRLVRH